MRIAARVLVVLFVGYIGYSQFSASWEQRQRLLTQRLAKSPFSGIWNVADSTGAADWRRLVVAGPGWGAIQSSDDTLTRYLIAFDETKKTVVFKKRIDPKFEATMQFTRPDAKTLTLDGTFEGKHVAATLHRSDDRTFLLTSRGFHWINEVPFNR
jgi:hypothetical protein